MLIPKALSGPACVALLFFASVVSGAAVRREGLARRQADVTDVLEPTTTTSTTTTTTTTTTPPANVTGVPGGIQDPVVTSTTTNIPPPLEPPTITQTEFVERPGDENGGGGTTTSPQQGFPPATQPTTTPLVGAAPPPPSPDSGASPSSALSISYSDGVPVVILSSSSPVSSVESATGTSVVLSGGVSVDPSRTTQTGFAAATPTSSSTSGASSARGKATFGTLVGVVLAVLA